MAETIDVKPEPKTKPAWPLFHEAWYCGQCGRHFEDCTSCVAHEAQCGGSFSRC
jgi:hypothetical protein